MYIRQMTLISFEKIMKFQQETKLEKIQTVKDLVLNLKQNPVLRYCCGFNVL